MMTRWFNSLPYVSPIVNEFIITVKTDNAGVSASNEILLPIQGTAMVIDWGDGSVSTHTQTAVPNNTIGGANVAKTYASAGVYQIKISSSITRIFFNNGGDRLKLLDINNWGKAVWSNFSGGFRGCTNLVVSAVDSANLSNCTSIGTMFNSCSSLITLNTSNWDTSNITSFSSSFSFCSNLTFLDSTSWDTSKVTNMVSTFTSCSNLQILNTSNWNVELVTNFFTCFSGCNLLNESFENFNLRTDANLGGMLNIGTEPGLNFQESYSRTLIGWANNIFSRGGVVTGRSLGANNRRYNNINYVSGQQFNNAVDARDYLVNTLGWTITGDAQV